jgi:hypothetical protein
MDRGDFPGYEFEVPRGPRYQGGQDPLRQFRYVPEHAQPRSPAPPARVAGGVFAVMRAKNWLTGLAVPILAAIVVGIAVVVITGGGGEGGTAPSALAAGYPPARVATANFAGAAASSRIQLTALAASGATEVGAGSADGRPALWDSVDGGSTFARGALAGAGTGQLTSVAHGAAGWLAVGAHATGGPLLISSQDAKTWTLERGSAGLPRNGQSGANGTVAAAAGAVGAAGYVIVGHQPADGTAAAAWYSKSTTGWRAATIAGQGMDQEMNAVTATSTGFAAVGASGSSPAIWLSLNGQAWSQAAVSLPSGASRAALDFVAATGSDVAAIGTEVSAAGMSTPFAEVSVDGGQTWTLASLPLPDQQNQDDTGNSQSQATAITVTAVTAAAGGFTATGTFDAPTANGGVADQDVVVWTLANTALADGQQATAWADATPQGIGLAKSGTQNAIIALTTVGATLTGVGFTATGGVAGEQRPTLWQSPVRS